MNLSQVLTDWAVRSSTDKILEPSFGGCGFLETSIHSLKSLGGRRPANCLYGADIDPHAFRFLSEKLGSLVDINSGHFIQEDFLKLRPDQFPPDKFDAIVGNPPYISHHNMSLKQRKSCSLALQDSPFISASLGMNVSLWAYFIIHALSFLNDGGRIAWVLPSSLLNTNYAKKLQSIYKNHFSTVKLIKLHKRYFKDSGADEVSVILLAENFQKIPTVNARQEFDIASNIEDLRNIAFRTENDTNEYQENYKLSIIGSHPASQFNELSNSKYSSVLEDLCTVSIGLVTGDNGTFVVNKSTLNGNSITPANTTPIISRFHQLPGIIHTSQRHEKLFQNDERCYLICPNSIKRKGTPIRNYLARVSRQKRKTNKTFPKRPLWYYPEDHQIPDAFLSYMVHDGPRLAVNVAKVNCTNSIHRVYFKGSIPQWKKKALALSLLSSFSQLSAELEGRSYGSGVLKLEPSAAKRIAIITHNKVLESLYNSVKHLTNLIESKQLMSATYDIDSIISKEIKIPPNIFSIYRDALKKLRVDRYKN